MSHLICRRPAGDARPGHTAATTVTDSAPPCTALTGSTAVVPEPLVTAYAALKALHRSPDSVIEHAHQALVRVGTGSAEVVDRLLAEIRARHPRGHAHAVELEQAFHTAYRLVVYGAPRSWG
jgi:pantoate kinase